MTPPASSPQWPTAPPSAFGLDAACLDGPFARLLARHRTRAAALVVGGHLVWERYWDGYGPTSRFDTYSIGKAFTAVAIGLLAAEGALSLDDPACRFLPAWGGDARREITVRHLLTMTSGLRRDLPRIAAAPDPTALALEWPLSHRPGAVWCYEQVTAHALVPIILRVTGTQPIDLLRERVLSPIGAGGVDWARAPSGDCTGWRSVLASARDLCRFGELLLRRGRWGGRALLDERFVARMLAVDPLTAGARAEPPRDEYRRRGYGFLVDLNAGGMWGCVGASAFALLGAWGNLCLVDPRHDFVLVRLVTPEGRVRADGAPDPGLFDNRLDVADAGAGKVWRAVLRAFPAERGLLRRLEHARHDVESALRAQARRRGIVSVPWTSTR